MSDKVTIVAYSEIHLKSPPVRRILERRLVNDLRFMLERAGVRDVKIGRKGGRIIINSSDINGAAVAASKVFGVASAMPAFTTSVTLSDIVSAVNSVAKGLIKPGRSFAVRARRVGEHPYTSMDIERVVGSEIVQVWKGRVDLENPELTIYVEAREDCAYIYTEVLKGFGGVPFGSQGRVVALFSGGVDSATASWMMMKRGAAPLLLYLNTSPFGDEGCYERALRVAEHLRTSVPRSEYKLFVGEWGPFLQRLVDKAPRRLVCVLCKRGLYKLARKLAEAKHASALVTGESLGQVASQTLLNIRVLDEASDIPVFRPLIGFDKAEIISLADSLGIRDLASVSMKRCAAVPSSPATTASLEDVKRVERELELDRIVDEVFYGITAVSV